jgi:hypothetical protein
MADKGEEVILSEEENGDEQKMKGTLLELVGERKKLELRMKEKKQIVDEHIQLLHTYNETKDSAQDVFGKLALATGETVLSVHERFSIDARD